MDVCSATYLLVLYQIVQCGPMGLMLFWLTIRDIENLKSDNVGLHRDKISHVWRGQQIFDTCFNKSIAEASHSLCFSCQLLQEVAESFLWASPELLAKLNILYLNLIGSE